MGTKKATRKKPAMTSKATVGRGLRRLAAEAKHDAGDAPVSSTIHARALADLLAVHRNTITNWLAEGLPILLRRGRVVEMDLATAVRWVRARDLASFEAKLEAATSTPDIDRERCRKLAAEADLSEMQRDERRGELVQAGNVEEKWSELMIGLREAVLRVPGVAVQAGLIRPGEEVQLDTLCRDALTLFGGSDAAVV